MATKNRITVLISTLLIITLIFTALDSVYAASSGVSKYRDSITKNRKYIAQKVKIYKNYEKYLTRAKKIEKKSKNTTSVATLKSYDKKVKSYAGKIKKVHKIKKNRVSWYKAPQIAGKKSVKWSSVNKGCKKLKGIPYKYGGSTRSGFDCSGFVSYVMDKNYGLSYTRYTSASARSKWANSKYEVYDSKYDGSIEQALDDDRIRPGDILVFIKNGKAYHMGIFAGYKSLDGMYAAPAQYDSNGSVRLWYLPDNYGRIQAYRGLYTKQVTSKKIAKYRKSITGIFGASLSSWESSEKYPDKLQSKLDKAKSYYSKIQQYENVNGQSDTTKRAKNLYDECIFLETEIKKEKATSDSYFKKLYILAVKTRDSRRIPILKKYKSNAASYKKIIIEAGIKMKENSDIIDTNISLLDNISNKLV